ncbi:hypothetical protein DEM27_29380 [Metarhizobium album]|uniref:HTH araC/xylS-type domain-containing protein n=1 Tax=Metarhizobium album TaxID=2182425 RepID=A0A2U2DHB0_9HYPH|nr:helix-turn-helix domain-containing protein [Rhizobium album]PWE52690.1 hypothetical protein DEM27_29380 [Rhizobium album]
MLHVGWSHKARAPARIMPLARIARDAGASPRTLQRRLRECRLPPPDFWRRLGRARRTVSALSADEPLAEMATDFGYSDQAHMTRECRGCERRFLRLFAQLPHQGRRGEGKLGRAGRKLAIITALMQEGDFEAEGAGEEVETGPNVVDIEDGITEIHGCSFSNARTHRRAAAEDLELSRHHKMKNRPRCIAGGSFNSMKCLAI